MLNQFIAGGFISKYLANETLYKFKARLIAKGYNQIEGLYYFEAYSLDAKLITVRDVITRASIIDIFIKQYFSIW